MSLFGEEETVGGTAGYDAVRIDEALAETLSRTADVPAVTVRPDKDNGGIEAMVDVLESLHHVRRSGGENTTPAYALEMRYATPPGAGDDTRAITMQYHASDAGQAGLVERQVQDQYPHSQVDRESDAFLAAEPGQYVAGATLDLRRYTLFPIRNIDLDGFRADPTGSVLSEMVGSQEEATSDADVVCQVMFRPADRSWTNGVENGHGAVDVSELHDIDAADEPTGSYAPGINQLSKDLKRETTVKNRLPLGYVPGLNLIEGIGYESLVYDPTVVDKAVAKLLEEQQGEKGWHLCLRVLAVSDDADVAVDRASRAADMFRNFYESNSEQTFVPQPLAGAAVRTEAERAATRTFHETGIVKAHREVAGLVNIPKAEYVNSSKMRWSLSKPGEGVPPGTPRFDFETAGVAGGSAGEKQLAMLGESDADAPYWYGFGTRHGVEAGVDADILNVHQFVGGSTGQGKTTWLVNLFSQVVNRGNGGLVFDPKGRDADEFIREWPDDRDEEDFIFVDLTDDYEKQVRFNFLEVPGTAEPGSRAFASAVEALCDDLVAMISQAGGDDNYWGALMNRVTRTLVRGMARSGRDCTLLDLAFCCTAPENREKFAEWMAEERMTFIEDAAARIRDKEDADLEPLAGRLDQWVQNDAIRNLISARESTVSIQDAVENGKVIVVRNDPSSGETEKRLFATALIRRAWVAIREADDTPPFYVICDEFDSIVTEESSIHTILSEARAFEFCLTLACQAPSNQLPDTVTKAIENQCETFITFNPGGRDDSRLISAQHSPDVDWEDLANLSPYKFYMRTHDTNDELTHSYKVDAFPPVGDVRTDVTGEAGMTDEALDAFKRRSVERYGAEADTAEEQKAGSPFSAGGDTRDDATADGLDPAGHAGDIVVKAAFDVGLHEHADGFAPVDMESVRERARQYLDRDALARAPFADIVERAEGIDFDDDTVTVVENGPSRFLQSGDSASAGALKHRNLLRDAYSWLTRLGLEVEIPTQAGDRDVDGVGHLRETVDLGAASNLRRAWETLAAEHPVLAELTDGGDVTIEAESSTSTKPAQTLRNLAKAHEQDERCLFVAREDDAGRVHDALARPPLVRSKRADGTERLYNDGQLTLADGRYPLRPAGANETVWHRLPSGVLVCEDSDGDEIARFDSPDCVWAGDDEPWPRVVTPDTDVGDEWVRVYAPLVPEVTFEHGDGLPTSESWSVLAVPEHDPERDPRDALDVVDTAGTHSLAASVDGADVSDTPDQDIDTTAARDALDSLD